MSGSSHSPIHPHRRRESGSVEFPSPCVTRSTDPDVTPNGSRIPEPLFPRTALMASTSPGIIFLLSVLSSHPRSPPLPGTLPYDIKIVIAGNHELTFDQEFMADLIKQDFYYFPSASKLKPESYENVQSLLTNCIYLQDSEVTVRGFRIYGSPW